MVAEQNKWVMYECEPCVWMLTVRPAAPPSHLRPGLSPPTHHRRPTCHLPGQVVRKTWAGSTATDAAFKALLATTYDVFVLLHGRVSTLLEQV